MLDTSNGDELAETSKFGDSGGTLSLVIGEACGDEVSGCSAVDCAMYCWRYGNCEAASAPGGDRDCKNRVGGGEEPKFLAAADGNVNRPGRYPGAVDR